MPPEAPKRPTRPGSSPELPNVVELDRTFAGADKQRRLDAPERRVTFTELPAVPPPVRNPLRHETIRADAPPPLVAASRRTDPPLGIRVPPTEARPTVPPGLTLPPPSATAEEASAAAQRRDLERLQAERDRAQAQLQLERLRAEEQAAAQEQQRLDAAAKLASLQIELAQARQVREPEKFAGLTLRQAFIGLVIAITALGAPLGAYVSVMAGTAKNTAERVETKTDANTKTVASAKTESGGTDKRVDELVEQLAAERSYNREVLRRMGVVVPKRPGDPDPPDLKTDTPLPKHGKVSGAPVLVVTTPPP